MYTFPFVPFRYSKTLTTGILIVILCLLPASELSKINVPITYTDVIVHFAMFFVFSSALILDITKKRSNNYKLLPVVIATIFVSFGLGFITELLQYLIIPLNRTGTMGDLLSDFLGSIAGAVMIAVIKRRSSVAP